MGTRVSSTGVLDGRRGQKLSQTRVMGIQTAVAVLMWCVERSPVKAKRVAKGCVGFWA